MTGEEWGPWIEHCGTCIPVSEGMMVHRIFDAAPAGGDAKGKTEHISPYKASERGSWIGETSAVQVIRYRIRKPRALTQLRDMVEKLPEPVEPVA